MRIRKFFAACLVLGAVVSCLGISVSAMENIQVKIGRL